MARIPGGARNSRPHGSRLPPGTSVRNNWTRHGIDELQQRALHTSAIAGQQQNPQQYTERISGTQAATLNAPATYRRFKSRLSDTDISDPASIVATTPPRQIHRAPQLSPAVRTVASLATASLLVVAQTMLGIQTGTATSPEHGIYLRSQRSVCSIWRKCMQKYHCMPSYMSQFHLLPNVFVILAHV